MQSSLVTQVVIQDLAVPYRRAEKHDSKVPKMQSKFILEDTNIAKKIPKSHSVCSITKTREHRVHFGYKAENPGFTGKLLLLFLNSAIYRGVEENFSLNNTKDVKYCKYFSLCGLEKVSLLLPFPSPPLKLLLVVKS